MVRSNEAQFEFWQDLAPGWLASESHTELVSASFGDAALNRLALQPGDQVVDIGCGSGSTTLALANAVGPAGRAVGIDIAPAMVQAAQEHARGRDIEHAVFVTADAQVDDLGDAIYDAAYSRFGVMFFADPVSAFGNIRRSLRSEGRLAFTCWTNIFANEWMFVPGSAVVSVTGALPPMPGPGEPGPFSLEDPERLEAVLRDSGFNDIEITRQEESIVIPREEIEALAELASRVGPVREALRTADPDTASAMKQAVRTALSDRIEHDELRLGASALIVTART